MKILVLIFFLCFLVLNSVQAAGPDDVLINEITWMGTTVSYNDEWIVVTN